MKLAPIALFVYNRPLHTKKTIEALKKNDLAKESELFIFSDGPKDKTAKDGVEEVRNYIKNLDGFKSITVVERDSNYGLGKSIIAGVTEIVSQYGKIIFKNKKRDFWNYHVKGLKEQGYNINFLKILGASLMILYNKILDKFKIHY